MAKRKAVSTKSVKEDEEFNPDPIVTDEISKDEQAAVKTVAKKKGLSSFGELLKAQNAKRKERRKLYGKED